jgi:hypothetical protein
MDGALDAGLNKLERIASSGKRRHWKPMTSFKRLIFFAIDIILSYNKVFNHLK